MKANRNNVTHLQIKREPKWRARPVFFKALLVVAMLAVVASSLTGCTALKRPEELAWQGMHVYDTLQTADIVDDACYKEGHAITSQIIGEQPTQGKVMAWGVGSALFHAGVSNLLITHDHPRLYQLWQVVTIADTGAAIGKGISIGVRIGAPNTRTANNGCKG